MCVCVCVCIFCVVVGLDVFVGMCESLRVDVDER